MTENDSEPIYVLHFLPNNAVGGISLQTLDIAVELNNQDYENGIVTPDDDGPLTDFAKDRGVDAFRFSYFLPKHFNSITALLWNLRWLFEFIPSIRKTTQEISEQDPEIVHLNGLLMLQPAIAAWRADVDIVWYLVSDNIYPGWLARILIPFINTVSSQVVLISEKNRGFYQQQDRDIDIIPGAIRVDEMRKEDTKTESIEQFKKQYNITDDDFVVVTIAKIDPVKGQEFGIRAANCSEEDFTYMIVGPTADKAYRDRLAKLIDKYELEDDVHITGFVDDKNAVLEVADLFLLPSKGEGTPLSIMEALAIETPVVATDVGGVSELLDDGRAGQLIPPESSEAIRNAIKTYKQNPDLMKEHSSHGLEHVVANYSIEEVAKLYDRVYSRCVNKEESS